MNNQYGIVWHTLRAMIIFLAGLAVASVAVPLAMVVIIYCQISLFIKRKGGNTW